MNFKKLLIYLVSYIVLLIVVLSGCMRTSSSYFDVKQKKIYAAIDNYLKTKANNRLEKNNNKPCIIALQKFLIKNTKWEISSLNCIKDSCLVKIDIREPVINRWIKSIMQQAFMEAIKKGGLKNIDKKTCAIIAKKVESSTYKPKEFKQSVQYLRIKNTGGIWLVKETKQTF